MISIVNPPSAVPVLVVMGPRGGWLKIAQDNKSFFKVTPLILAIEDQNNET